ncbi:hypothetical protein [Actinosynnema sp. NPDC020468]|uniref:hypothetical protein n=1 Tax=Actinosynnema sp. NPDC020468 TaxID=3154488 RepID=UPI0033E5397B
MDHVDAYCERLDASFWAEPLNAVSNLAFLIAAVLLWVLYRPASRSLRALPVLLALVGLASFAFHTLATTLTSAGDVGFIGVFVVWYLVCFGHWFGGLSWPKAWWAVPAFALVYGAMLPLAEAFPGGSGGYLAPWLALVVVAVVAAVRRLPWHDLAVAAGIFVVSLTLRTLDQPLCGDWPSGTHYAWHTLNAVVLFLVARAAIRREREVGRP